jgi:uncharacterized protein (DUF934 family)
MLLDKSGALGPDPWRHLADAEAPEGDAAATVSFARWTKEREFWAAREGKLGVRLPNDAAPETIAADVGRFALIVLDFPRFTDGRAYSQARLLRGRLGYRGELRASGHVLRDQLLFMKRCGFDSFVVDAGRAVAENWPRAFREFDLFYQPANDGQPTVMRRRFGPWPQAAE